MYSFLICAKFCAQPASQPDRVPVYPTLAEFGFGEVEEVRGWAQLKSNDMQMNPECESSQSKGAGAHTCARPRPAGAH